MPGDDPNTAVEVRFIEVKGRTGVGEVAVMTNEYRSAQRLKDDCWLYVVFDCDSTPKLHVIRNPASLGWRPIVNVEYYACDASRILEAEEKA